MKQKSFRHILTAILVLFIPSISAISKGALKDQRDIVQMNIRENGLVASFFYPKGGKNLPAVIALGGSDGGIKAAEFFGSELAQEGYAVLALVYFNYETLPKTLGMIPLEYFEKAIKWVKSNQMVDPDKLGIIGGSKGGELTLLLGSRYPDFRAVAATVPSICVFQGIGGGSISSWSYKGKGLDYVPYHAEKGTEYGPGNWAPLYVDSYKQKEFVKKAIIKVENINGPLILFSGEKDKIWPSATFCRDIVKRLKEKNFNHPVIHIYDKNKGHNVGRLMKNKWIGFFKKYLK